MKGTSGVNTTVAGVQNNSGNKQRYDFLKTNDGTIAIQL
jgi:hypothetical protein